MTEALKQNDAELYIPIAQIGCFFRSSANMAEQEAEKEKKPIHFLTAEQLNKLWDLSINFKYIKKELDPVTNKVDYTVILSAAIANLALDMLGISGRFVEVATFQNGKMNWYGSVKGEQKRADYFIQRIKQNGPSKTHFRNVYADGVLLWDPHRPQIQVQDIYYTICYRFDKR